MTQSAKYVFLTMLVFVGTFAGFFILEVVVRVIPKQASPAIMEENPHVGQSYKPNLDIWIPADEGEKKNIHLVTNSHGLIGPEWEGNTDTLRIAHLGDSFTAGIQSVSYNETYAYMIGELLSRRLGVPVGNFNFGVGGFGTGDALNAYLYYARDARPDIVLLWAYLGNDFDNNFEDMKDKDGSISEPAIPSLNAEKQPLFLRLAVESKLMYYVKDKIIQSGLHRSIFNLLARIPGVERLLYNVYLPTIPEEIKIILTNDERNGDTIIATEEYLESLKREIEKDVGRFFVFIIPAHFQVDEEARGRLMKQYPDLTSMGFDVDKSRQVFIGILKKQEIPYLDLTPLFKEATAEGKSLYACRFCHFSEEGHRETASIAAEEIYRRYLGGESIEQKNNKVYP